MYKMIKSEMDSRIIGPTSLNYLCYTKVNKELTFNNKKIYLWFDNHNLFYNKSGRDKRQIGIKKYIWKFVKLFNNPILYLEVPVNMDRLNIKGHKMSLYSIYEESKLDENKSQITDDESKLDNKIRLMYVDIRNQVNIGLLAEKLRHNYIIEETDLNDLNKLTKQDVSYFISEYEKYLKYIFKDFKNNELLDTIITICILELVKNNKINETIIKKLNSITVNDVNTKKTENPIIYIEPIVGIIMDISIILRISINNNENQIFYGGDAHSDMITVVLTRLGFKCKQLNTMTIKNVSQFVSENGEC